MLRSSLWLSGCRAIGPRERCDREECCFRIMKKGVGVGMREVYEGNGSWQNKQIDVGDIIRGSCRVGCSSGILPP
jgi:hypothetical protein